MRIQHLLLLAASGAALIAGSATAQEASELTGVTVTGQTESREGYKVSKTLSAMKTDTDLIDVPQSVSIVSIKQIDDQAAGNIGEAIRYLPGVFSAHSTWIWTPTGPCWSLSRTAMTWKSTTWRAPTAARSES